MSIQQLEQRVRNLSAEDLLKFSAWFDTYRDTVEPADAEDGELSAGQRAEIDSRLEALDADPSIAVPWEGTKEKVLKKLDELPWAGRWVILPSCPPSPAPAFTTPR